MNQNDLNAILSICKKRIDIDENYDDLKAMHGVDVFTQIEAELQSYIEKKNARYEANKPYWMLISNPSMWGDATDKYEVNQLLFNLNNETIQAWKINHHTSMERQMKTGELGIIKVSDDKRTKAERTNDDGEILPLLDSGIYGIFEVVEDEDGDCTYLAENGDWYVNIHVIDNFYAKGKNISKEISKELLGDNVYNSIPSTKIDKKLFNNVVNYIENK
jgi:hypothetical protein